MEHRNYDELYSSLSDEKKAMIDSCKSPQDLAKVLGKLGIALPDALLETVSGGRNYEEVGQEDYDNWLRNAYVPYNYFNDRDPYTYYTTWNIPKICELPDESARSIAVMLYCEIHHYTVGFIYNYW